MFNVEQHVVYQSRDVRTTPKEGAVCMRGWSPNSIMEYRNICQVFCVF